MAVLPYSNTSCIHGATGRTTGNTNTSTATTTSTIQPSVKTIVDLARECDQHVVRLYFLPTPGTNGFTTTHTLVRNDTRTHPVTNSVISTAVPAVNNSVPTTSGSSHRLDTNGDSRGAQAKQQRRRRICHLTRVSESERGIVHLARLHISSMVKTNRKRQTSMWMRDKKKHCSTDGNIGAAQLLALNDQLSKLFGHRIDCGDILNYLPFTSRITSTARKPTHGPPGSNIPAPFTTRTRCFSEPIDGALWTYRNAWTDSGRTLFTIESTPVFASATRPADTPEAFRHCG
jgi:hypothetical protein